MTRGEAEAAAEALAVRMLRDARRVSETNYLLDGFSDDEIAVRLYEMDQHNAKVLRQFRRDLKAMLDRAAGCAGGLIVH